MTSILALPYSHAGRVTREPSREPTAAPSARDLYAAWQAIFENARPAHPGQAHSLSDRELAMRDRNNAGPASDAEGRGDEASGDAPTTSNPSGASALAAAAGANAGESPPQPSVRIASAGEFGAMNLRREMANAATTEAPSDVVVRVHYVRSVSAQPDNLAQPEVISIVLDGNEVTIFVRDTGLEQAEALRAAFQTARELTGRSASLRQLTLNGRVLYQSSPSDAAPADGALFSC